MSQSLGGELRTAGSGCPSRQRFRTAVHSPQMSPLADVVATLLKECGARPTGAGLIGDVRHVADIAGVPFTTLRETVEELARQFNVDLDPSDQPPLLAEPAEDGWDAWAERLVRANAAASIFNEDDATARRLLKQRPSSVFDDEDEGLADQLMLQQQLAPPT
mmetsp:Transcript_1101/g.2767  ORF Transcript_1101/g.2767 Transcript_1101/m.2767 type:complete len:162 (-) Transcript_1101:221-706(-)